MTRDDTIRFLHAADVSVYSLKHIAYSGNIVDVITKVANLVADATRREYQAQIELWKGEAATAEKWRAMALGRDPAAPGMTVRAIKREARAAEREACAKRRGVLMFNPYTGTPRHPSDIASDPHGILLVDPDQPIRATGWG